MNELPLPVWLFYLWGCDHEVDPGVFLVVLRNDIKFFAPTFGRSLQVEHNL